MGSQLLTFTVDIYGDGIREQLTGEEQWQSVATRIGTHSEASWPPVDEGIAKLLKD